VQTLPKISIVIPSFNQGRYIEQTIRSIIDQQYEHYELIIIDGGSTDDTIDIIRKYEPNIAYWISEKDNGQADAINKGLTKATGDVFNWINSDDYLEAGSLNVIGEYFAGNPGKNILCGFTRCFFDDDNSTSHTYRMGIKKTATGTILNIEMNQPGTFYRMNIVKALGGINASLRYVFDDELWIRFLAKYGVDTIGTTEKLLAQFRLHKDSKSVLDGYAKFIEESKEVWLFLAEKLAFSANIAGLMKDEVITNKYKPNDWAYTYIDRLVMERFFAAKYMLSLLKKGQYMEARWGWIYRFKKEPAILRRMVFSTFVKLFVFPGYFKS
jgi:glycosyltransferase involved in cell wall biosynthesis